jgi:hypothetical protein
LGGFRRAVFAGVTLKIAVPSPTSPSVAFAAGRVTLLNTQVLSGSNRCPVGKRWCGYSDPAATPQALLFKSADLLSWSFVTVFWSAAKW